MWIPRAGSYSAKGKWGIKQSNPLAVVLMIREIAEEVAPVYALKKDLQ